MPGDGTYGRKDVAHIYGLLARIFHETAQLDIEPVILCSISTIRARQRSKSGAIALKKLNFCCESQELTDSERSYPLRENSASLFLKRCLQVAPSRWTA